MAGFHLVFCADPAATGIMIYKAASAYKEAGIFEREGGIYPSWASSMMSPWPWKGLITEGRKPLTRPWVA